ncbi:MAG: hypothetical protein OK455_04345 [Thaumarchaeota archaeon]|nr:hypothetical protein [Nitrososphaerota archaeon]
MISTYRRPLWLGYAQAGGAADVKFEELKGRLLLLGRHANEIAALFAYASHEAGLRPMILDIDGHLSSLVSGYFAHYELQDVLYDLYRLNDEDERRHGELIASAYTAALDLTTEEEAILNGAMQQLALQDNMASPPVVYDALSGVEGFRGFYVDKLKGRIGTLRSLDAADSISLRQILAHDDGVIIDLSGSGHPRAAELGAALFTAKLVSLLRSPTRSGKKPDFFLLTDAHHVFKELPRVQHGSRLLTSLLEAPTTSVLASDQVQALDSHVLTAFPTKILSADAWNQTEKDKRRFDKGGNLNISRGDRPGQPATAPVLPNSFVIHNGFYGTSQPFVARPFQVRVSSRWETGRSKGQSSSEDGSHPGDEAGDRPASETGGGGGDSKDEITRRVLEQVRAYDSATIPSLIAYLSSEFPWEVVQKAVDDLEKSGDIELHPKQQRSGRTMLGASLTPQGEELLRRLSE